MERLWMLVMMYPGPTRWLGRSLMTASLVAGSLGWQVSRGLERASRNGVDLSGALAAFPTWLLPLSFWGFALTAFLFVIGAGLAQMGRWAARVSGGR